jgi:hypothetical protein
MDENVYKQMKTCKNGRLYPHVEGTFGELTEKVNDR